MEREARTTAILREGDLGQVHDHAQVLVSAEEGVGEILVVIGERGGAPSVLVDCKRRQFVGRFTFHVEGESKLVIVRGRMGGGVPQICIHVSVLGAFLERV